jgi:hypothetical protein
MPQYMFTFDERDNSFPERYRVVSRDEDAEFLRETENLTGTVLDTQAIEFLDGLLARCQSNQSMRAEFVDAPYWRFIELRFNPAEAERAASASTTSSDGGITP